MQLWHKGLLCALPARSLITLWHECCAIARNLDLIGTPNDILVNRVTDYPLSHFYAYSVLVLEEINKRGFVSSSASFIKFEDHIFKAMEKTNDQLDDIRYDMIFYDWHNDRYFWQCIGKLEELYDCGGISDSEWDEIEEVSVLYAYPCE